MTRRAVEDFLRPAPEIVADPNSERHPFNRGLVWSDVGNLSVYMLLDEPGKFWLDLYGTRPATDAQARAAFGIEAYNRYRAQAQDHAADLKIEAALASQPEPELEDLKAKAQRLARKVRAERLVKELSPEGAYVAHVRAAAQG